jgi:hypothetical protein
MAPKRKTTLPDAEGYAVNANTGTVHERYAAHAGDAQRVRTEAGVRSVLGDAEPQLCAVCFPDDVPQETPNAEG